VFYVTAESLKVARTLTWYVPALVTEVNVFKAPDFCTLIMSLLFVVSQVDMELKLESEVV